MIDNRLSTLHSFQTTANETTHRWSLVNNTNAFEGAHTLVFFTEDGKMKIDLNVWTKDDVQNQNHMMVD